MTQNGDAPKHLKSSKCGTWFFQQAGGCIEIGQNKYDVKLDFEGTGADLIHVCANDVQIWLADFNRWVQSLDPKPRPTITVLCGSTRFGEAFHEANLRLTLDGHIVLTIGCDTKSDDELAKAGVVFDEALKDRLDELHKRKIELADQVFIINPGGYVGESTLSEIRYARLLGKPVAFLVQTEWYVNNPKYDGPKEF